MGRWVITILLADDHALVRQGVHTLLEPYTAMTVVGEAANGLEAVRLTERLQPNVLILDLVMPGLGGLEVIRHVKQSSPETQIVVLTMHSCEGYVVEAFRLGATAYVLKDSMDEELVCAVREAARGQCYLGTPFAEGTVAEMARQIHAGTPLSSSNKEDV